MKWNFILFCLLVGSFWILIKSLIFFFWAFDNFFFWQLMDFCVCEWNWRIGGCGSDSFIKCMMMMNFRLWRKKNSSLFFLFISLENFSFFFLPEEKKWSALTRNWIASVSRPNINKSKETRETHTHSHTQIPRLANVEDYIFFFVY